MIVDYATVSDFITGKDSLIQNAISSQKFGELWNSLNINESEQELVKAWITAPQIAGLKVIFDMPALVINILITWLVYRGIKESRNASNAMVILKILVVVLVIIVGAFYIDIDNFKPFMPEGFHGG